jgi:uncharacterized membrane protein YuzA (DUF378 family)
MKTVHIVAFILLVVGGLNWLLFAFGWNLVSVIFGAGSTLSDAIYILIGLAAILEAVTHGKNCRTCGSGAMAK